MDIIVKKPRKEDPKKANSRRRFSKHLKYKIIRESLTEGADIGEICKKYHIQRAQLNTWKALHLEDIQRIDSKKTKKEVVDMVTEERRIKQEQLAVEEPVVEEEKQEQEPETIDILDINDNVHLLIDSIDKNVDAIDVEIERLSAKRNSLMKLQDDLKTKMTCD